MNSSRQCLPCVRQSSSHSGGYGRNAAPRENTSNGSQTMTITEEETLVSRRPTRLILRLKAEVPEKTTTVKWSDDTIDNENLGRKTSKRCCIYRKVCNVVSFTFHYTSTSNQSEPLHQQKKAFAESDSDESDSDTEAAARAIPKPGQPKNYQRHHA